MGAIVRNEAVLMKLSKSAFFFPMNKTSLILSVSQEGSQWSDTEAQMTQVSGKAQAPKHIRLCGANPRV